MTDSHPGKSEAGSLSTGHLCMADRVRIGRRSLLLGLGASLAVGRPSLAQSGASGAPRLVIINTRGGLDGLSLVAPYGDKNLAPLRAQIMAPPVGTAGGMFDLGGFFGLHPAMPSLYAMYQAGEAAMVHAVGNIVITRSHFDGQDCLQSGAAELLTSGWLNRVMGAVGSQPGMQSVISMAACQPLITQGANISAGWSPGSLGFSSTPFITSLTQLLQNDALLGPAYRDGYQDRALFSTMLKQPPMPSGLSGLQELAWAAGDFLASANGPRIAAIQTESFDTHCYQVARMNTGLADLDGALACLKTALGSAWAQTVVMTMTEFGRTAAANGNASCGTDHGTAFAVILAGGAVAGGKVLATWPGLAANQLYQGRDLAPTVDVRSIAVGILQQHMGIPASALQTVFPGAAVTPMTGLVNS
jgi:uncharacterized protein (DUF1501 family)